jgi:carboxyl-terminal processing protease
VRLFTHRHTGLICVAAVLMTTGGAPAGPGVVGRAVVLAAAGDQQPPVQSRHDLGVAAFDQAWSTVNETSVDPSFGGLNWAAVRDELRPRVVSATSAEQQRAVIREMLERLGQSHFALISYEPSSGRGGTSATALRGPATVPFDVRVVAGSVVVTRVDEPGTTLVRPGDSIVAIDDRDVAGLLAVVAPGHPRRAEVSWRLVSVEFSGAPGSVVRLAVRTPAGDVRELAVQRRVGPGDLVTIGNLPPMRAQLDALERRTLQGRRVGVIRFNVWMAASAEPFAAAVDRFRDADGLVIDIRGNPGGLADMIRGIAGHVVNEPAVLGRMRMRGLDLEFRSNPRRSTRDGRSVTPFAGPVAILVDELTASASECFAGGLQAIGRARVFGTRTAGQALPASTRQLVSGDVLLYAVGDFVTSTGQRLEGVGVVPDVEVPTDPQALAAGRDAEHAALDWFDRVSPPTTP